MACTTQRATILVRKSIESAPKGCISTLTVKKSSPVTGMWLGDEAWQTLIWSPLNQNEHTSNSVIHVDKLQGRIHLIQGCNDPQNQSINVL